MDQFTKEGRKLRPRKSAAGSAASSERVEYHPGEHRTYGESRGSYGEHRSNNYGERRSYGNGERRSYGEGRNYGSGEHRSNFGGGSGERRSYGEGRSYGSGEHRSNFGGGSGERRSYGEGRSYGSGEHRSNFSGGSGERRSYGSGNGRPSYGSKPSSGGRKQFGRKPAQGRPYGKKNDSLFNKNTSEGIDRMISRRPVVNGSEAEFDNIPMMTFGTLIPI